MLTFLPRTASVPYHYTAWLVAIALEINTYQMLTPGRLGQSVRPFDDRNAVIAFENLIQTHHIGNIAFPVKPPKIDVINVECWGFVEVYEREARACHIMDIVVEPIQYALCHQGFTRPQAAVEENNLTPTQGFADPRTECESVVRCIALEFAWVHVLLCSDAGIGLRRRRSQLPKRIAQTLAHVGGGH